MKFIAVALAGLLVAGCATVPDRAPVADRSAAWQERQAKLAKLDAWEVRGRIALRSPNDGGQASMHWLHQGNSHQLDFAGPFGGGRVRLTQDASGATLRDSSGRSYHDVSMQQLLMRATGWQLPLDGINYWILGLPAPVDAATQELDEWGRLRKLSQLGWEINFLAYGETDGHELPTRVFIKRQLDDAEGALEVRVAVETWKLGNPVAN